MRKLRISWTLTRWAARQRTAQVVQIGAHTASIGDPLQPLVDRYTGWRVLFVEPIPEYFDELVRRRGGDPRFHFIRAAITDHDGEVEMTTVVQGPDVPSWTNQLSSIHRETVLWHEQFLPGLRDAIRQVTVPAMTFATLLATTGVQHIDLLLIDTEGHDAAILEQVDFTRWRPGLIAYEHGHLGRADREACQTRLRAAGYRLAPIGGETLATL